MPRRSPLQLWLIAVASAFAAVIVLIPTAVLALLYAGPLEGLRRAGTEYLLGDALDLDIAVRGPIRVGFGWEADIAITDPVAVESKLPSDLKEMSAKTIHLKLPLMPLLAGQALPNSLEVDGLKLDINIPEGNAPAADDVDAGEIIADFLRSGFADDLLLRGAELNYVNAESGFDLRYSFDEIATRPRQDGGVDIGGSGRLNGEPWKLAGNVDPAGDDPKRRKFSISIKHAGLDNNLAGIYAFDTGGDTIDTVLTATAPKLGRFLAVYGISGDLAGTGHLTGKLAGRIDSLKLNGLDLKLAFERGDTLALTGDVGNLATGAGLELKLAGSLAREPLAQGQQRPIYDIGIKGFHGRIEGSTDGMLAKDFHIITSSVTASLRDIGPITAQRLYKDREGRLGLYDVLVLAGDPKQPRVRVEGTVKDLLNFAGVDLKGQIDFLTTDFLDLAAEQRAEELGHLKGDIAISDADGSLGIEAFDAEVTGSSLIALTVNLVFDDLEEAKELRFATKLDIPRFKPFAAALGTPIEEDVGTVKFDGAVTGSAQQIAMDGTALVGQTTIKGALAGSLAQNKPVLAGDLSTPLLHLVDLVRLASINTVYQANADEGDEDLFNYDKIWETLFVDMQIKVARIAGGGNTPSNIQGRVTYLAGMVGLDPVTLVYLGGRASANGKIDTTGAAKTFALKGDVVSLPIGTLLKQMQSDYPVSGALNMNYDLSGTAVSKAQIPKSLNGNLTISLRNGWIGTSLLDLTGMTLPAWLLARAPGGNQATLVCVVAPFNFTNGRGATHGLVLETKNVQIAGVGYIDFRRSEIDLRFKPQPLQRQFINVAQPFAISGALASPRVRLTGAPVAGAVVGILAFPFNLLDTIVLPRAEDPRRVPCQVRRVSGARRASAPAVQQRRGGPLGLGIFGGQRR
jgi:hypothetical protein